MSGTVGVAIFVLRRTARHETEVLLRRTARHETEVLLRRAGAAGTAGWSPVGGAIEPGEREADAALRELRDTASLEPTRLYAAAFSDANDDAGLGPVGRIGVFVAFLAADAPAASDPSGRELAWHPLRDAGGLLALARQRPLAERVHSEFVRRSPDEALRVV